MRLTDLAIRKLPHPEKGQKTFYDDQLPGFGIRLSSRAKSFIVMYGRSRRLRTLGRYPAMSLKEARRKAQRYLSQEHNGLSEMSFVEAKAAYLEECEEKNRSKTVNEYRRYLDMLDFSGPVRNVSRQQLAGLIGSPHALTAYKVFFNWCVRNEVADRNPLAGDRAKYNAPKTRVLSADEIKAVWAYERKPFSDVVKLLLIMGQRRTETSLIEAEWIDGDLLHIPTSVTKNRKPHVIPIGSLAKPLLPPETIGGWSKYKKLMDKDVDIDHWTLHDLRRTFSTLHAQIGTPIHVTEKLLNHTSGSISGVAAIYNRHTYLDEMRAAVEAYDAHLQSLLDS